MKSSRKSIVRAIADRLLASYVGPSYREEFLGDLEEIYEERVRLRGRIIAGAMYWIDAIHLAIGFSHTTPKNLNTNSMFVGNMIRIAWRSALRQKQFTILNLLGLTLGIATCLGIGLYVYDETQFDKFYPNGHRVFRINQPMIWGNWDEQFSSTGPGVAEAIKADIPEVDQVTRVLGQGERTIRVTLDGKATQYIEDKAFIADDNFFKVFAFPFKTGNPTTALREPNSVVITAATAQRYFGGTDPMGQIIEVKLLDGSYMPYTVKGVINNIPSNSHLQFDMLGSMSSVREMKDHSWKWIWTAFGTYVMTRDDANIPLLEEKLQALPPKWAATTTKEIFNQSFDEFTAGKKWMLYLQPLKDIYLARTPDFHRFGPSGNTQFMVIFTAIGALVLALSCINFMNLSTARSSNRAKEVGVRKVLGSEKRTLVRQFIIESVLYVFVATIAAMIVVQLFITPFNQLASKQLSLFSHLGNPVFIAILLSFILVLGIAAGSYPAFYLSAFNPAETLKGKIRNGFKGAFLRNTLVVFQFAASIVLIICTLFVQKQLKYTSTLDVGLTKENVLQLHNIDQLGTNAKVLQEKLRQHPAFTIVAHSYSIPPHVWEGDRYHAEGPDKPVIDMSYMRIDENYLPLLKTEFLKGRNFDPSNPGDKHKIILNEEGAKVLGLGTRETWDQDSPIGKFVVQAFDKEYKLEIVGIVKDFNFNSVKEKILPLLIMHEDNDLHWSYHQGRSFLSMRINASSVQTSEDIQTILDDVKKEVTAIDASVMFQYSFMDEEFNDTFRSEQRMASILRLFTGLAVVIACLGLFGLAAFSAEQRKRELGIRKLHGASVQQIVVLFSSEFTRLVTYGILIAVPVAWYCTDYWLSSFPYRTSIDVWVFGVAATGSLAIAAITVGFQSFSAARANPVDVLRSE